MLTGEQHEALAICEFVAQTFGVLGRLPSDEQRDTLRRMYAVLRPASVQGRTLDERYLRGTLLVAEHATRVQALADPGQAEREALRLVLHLDHVLDDKIHVTWETKLPECVQLLRSYSPSAKGVRGKRSAAAVLARILNPARALGHTPARSLVQTRQAIEAGARRERKRR